MRTHAKQIRNGLRRCSRRRKSLKENTERARQWVQKAEEEEFDRKELDFGPQKEMTSCVYSLFGEKGWRLESRVLGLGMEVRMTLTERAGSEELLTRQKIVTSSLGNSFKYSASTMKVSTMKLWYIQFNPDKKAVVYPRCMGVGVLVCLNSLLCTAEYQIKESCQKKEQTTYTVFSYGETPMYLMQLE